MAQLKILLLQARNNGDPVRREERQAFAAKTGLAVDQIVLHDLLAGPPSLPKMKQHDALMVGGSGEYSVANGGLPHFRANLDFFAELAAIGHPTFASCFGFQLLAEALGGRVVHDVANAEVGTYELELTADGRQDPLLGRLPATFSAQMGRKDRAERLPAGLPALASSTRNPHQAFRLPDTPIWATQFHPELDVDSNLQRFERYLKMYSQHMTPEEQQQARERFQPSPHTERLLPAFLELVFG